MMQPDEKMGTATKYAHTKFTVKNNNLAPEKIGVNIPKLGQCDFTIEQYVQKMQTEWQTV